MASLKDLKQAVSQLLAVPGVRNVLQLNSNTRERAFEAYVFALLLKAVRQANGTVQLTGITSGPNPTRLVFRGSPGQMSSRTQDFLYADCTINSRRFEVHLDVQYQGNSGATHEIDVSLYDHARADSVRINSTLPVTRYLHGAIECKFYDSTLGTALGRAFVGLTADCGSLQIKGFATNGHSAGLAKYFHQKPRPVPSFGLSPLRIKDADRFVTSVEQSLRQWAEVL